MEFCNQLRNNSLSMLISTPIDALRGAVKGFTPSDKISKKAVIVIIAIAIFAILAVRYAVKLKDWVQAYRVNYLNEKRRIIYQKGVDISLDRAKQIGSKLLYLDLKSKSIDDLIEYFKLCPNIERIKLNDCPITKDLLERLPKNLNTLQFFDCQLADSSLEGLKVLSGRLRYLELVDCDLNGVLFDRLPNKLETLYIGSCKNVSLSSFSVKELLLSSNKGVVSINNTNGSIEHLNIWIGGDGVVLDHLPNDLKKLSAVYCEKLSLDHLPTGLKRLELISCSFLNPALNQLPKGLEHLKLWSDAFRLRFRGSLSLDALPSKLETLELDRVVLSSFNNIPPKLKKLKLSLCNLTGVSLDLPDSLTPESVEISLCSGIFFDDLSSNTKNKIVKYALDDLPRRSK